MRIRFDNSLQLHALGAADSPILDQTEKAAMVLMLMYEEVCVCVCVCVFVRICVYICSRFAGQRCQILYVQLGDRIAMQYAGSGAHKKVTR